MLKKAILEQLQDYVDQHFIHKYSLNRSISFSPFEKTEDKVELEAFIRNNRKPSFSQLLFQHIDQQGHSDSYIYKKARIDRRHFSKIRSNPSYRIGKNPVISLALALELTKKETEELLSSAGFSLSENTTFDLVIQFCLTKQIYDIDEVNEALDYFSLKPLN